MSKRESVLSQLFTCLSGLSNVSVKRNEVLPQKIPATGIVILRDGNIGEPEVLLSPACYVFNHRAELEVIVQKETATERDQTLDNLLLQIGQLLNSNPTLSGQVDYMHADPPEFVEEPVEGGITIKAALVPIILEYSSNSNLT